MALLELSSNWVTWPLTNWFLACSVMHKHAMELRKMADAEHVHLVPLIEAALAIMRLSCEKVGCLPMCSRCVVQACSCGVCIHPHDHVTLTPTWCRAVFRAGLGLCGVPAVPGAAAHGAPRHPAERAPVGYVPKGGAMQGNIALLANLRHPSIYIVTTCPV